MEAVFFVVVHCRFVHSDKIRVKLKQRGLVLSDNLSTGTCEFVLVVSYNIYA